MTKLLYHVAGAVKQKRNSENYFYGKLLFDKLSYYDVETDTRHIDDELPDLDDLDDDERIEVIEEYTRNSALNIRNLLQVCVLIPANARGAELELADRYDQIELNNVIFNRLYFGHINVAKSKIAAHALDVAKRFYVFRKQLKSHKIFCGFNNTRFDGGIFPKILNETDVYESLTHKLSIASLPEFDLINWSRAMNCQSLKSLGQLLTKNNYDAIKYDDLRTADQKLMDRYNSRDCEIIAHFVHLLNSLNIHHHNMPSFVRWTIGNIFIDNGINKVFSPDYFQTLTGVGGRTEAYSTDLANSFIYDANSLYPTVQALLPFPSFKKKKDGAASVELRKLSKLSVEQRRFKERVKELYARAGNEVITSDKYQRVYKEIFENKQYFLKVKIKTINEDYLDIFPFGYKDNESKLVFFNFNSDVIYEIDGYNITWLAVCDYEIIDMRVSISEKLIFSDYIKDVYKKRQEYKKSGSQLEYLMKIILNAGFGIWGSRGDKTRRDMTKKTRESFESTANSALVAFNTKIRSAVIYDSQMQSDVLVVKTGNALYTKAIGAPRFVAQSIPSISQMTLSHARAFMYSVMRVIIRAGGVIKYTDTDSLFVDEVGQNALVKANLIGTEMGMLKLEDSVKNGFAVAPKLYNYTSVKGVYKCKSKGVKNPAARNQSVRTNAVDELQVVQKIVAKAGGVTKRKVVGDKHVNMAGNKDKQWSAVFEKFLKLHAAATGSTIDEKVMRGFLREHVEDIDERLEKVDDMS